jgi:hypothetical protein
VLIPTPFSGIQSLTGNQAHYKELLINFSYDSRRAVSADSTVECKYSWLYNLVGGL